MLVVLLAALGWTGFARLADSRREPVGRTEPSAEQSATQATAATPPRNRTGDEPRNRTEQEPRYRTEQEWIVSDVIGAIAGMAEYARTGKVGAADIVTVLEVKSTTETPPSFEVRGQWDGSPLTLTINKSFWRPEDYVAAAATFFRVTPRTPAPGTGPMDLKMIAALTEPRTSVLIEQDARISKGLAGAMRPARAHEQAALLMGTLLLREAAGRFDDVRSGLSRMTAHLACAQVLRGAEPQSAEGFLAENILALLSGHQEFALAGLRSADTTGAPAPLQAWVRALTMRITGDWRALPQPHAATLLERLEYARAIHDRLATNRLMAFLDGESTAAITDWQHIVLQRGFTVEAGNMFTGEPLILDFQEARDIWIAYHEGDPDGGVVIKDLNDQPWGSPAHDVDGQAVVHVLDWGRWAAFLQRHICAHLTARVRQHRHWGLKQENAQFFGRLEALLGELSLYPLVLRTAATDEEGYKQAMAGSRTLVHAHPERVTAETWYLLLLDKPSDYKTARTEFPSTSPWFSDLLAGAPFDLRHRILRPHHTAPTKWLELWKKQRPYDSGIAWAFAYSRAGGTPTLQATLEALGPLAEYDMLAIDRINTYLPLTMEQTITMTRKACDADVDRCARLANALVQAGRDAEAVTIYEQWAEHAMDRVGVSNGLTWLVRYYAETHRLDRAQELAEMAASTGSSIGLDTLAELLDRQGRRDEAEAIYQRIASRYDEHGDLAAFYSRMARRSDAVKYELKAKQELKSIFEKGIEPVSAATLTKTAPVDGMTFDRLGPRALACGLREGDIVVGVDGTRIHNTLQFRVASSFADVDDTRMELVIWRDRRYQTVKLQVPQRWFGVIQKDYKPESPTQATK
jgi:tetratricopeptide (TPR) repeat protein